MIEHRPFTQLGSAHYGWLDARYHFSFAGYHDPQRLHWGALRVWNDDCIEPNTGFPLHPHANMEIITYVREGAITHQDNLGNQGRTEAGDVQVMSAGSGIAHSEYNRESTPTRLFQIWIHPNQQGSAPYWGSKPFPKNDRANRFVVLASGFDEDTEALPIRSHSRVLGATLNANMQISYDFLSPERFGYLVVAKGTVIVNNHLVLQTRDGAAIQRESRLQIQATEDAELVLVDTSA